MDLIERTNCPTCDSVFYKKLFSIPYHSNEILSFLDDYYENKIPKEIFKNKFYELLECNNCSLIFQRHIPDDDFSFELYENIISKEISLKKKLNNKNLNNLYDKEIKLIKKIFNKKQIDVLEFGAGWGFWSMRALNLGLNVDCFELSKTRIEYMKNNNLNVLNDLDKLTKQYDLIYSDQTLEHIPNPRSFFKDLLPNLKKSGYFMLNFPTTYNFKNKLKKNYKPKKDAAHPLEHINSFNRRSFRNIIKDNNLELINFKWSHDLSLKNFFRDLKNYFYFDNILLKKK